KRYEVRLINTCDCGGPLFARYEWTDLGTGQLAPRKDLWRYAPLLPLTDSEIQSRGEGGTPLHRLQVFGSGGRVAPIKVEGLYVKDEGRNPTGTFKARGMAVAVPMARALGATHLVAPTAGNAGAALALFAAVHRVRSIVLLAKAGSDEAAREALLHGAHLVRVDGDIAAAGLCVPSTIADRLVLKALRETRGAATAVSDDAMRVAAQNLAVFEGIATCLEGAATFAGFRRLYDDGVITKEDQVVLVNTGSPRGSDLPPLAAPTVRTADEARTQLGLTKRAS